MNEAPVITYWPPFESLDDLNDIVCRACWYLACLRPASINLFYDGNFTLERPSYFSSEIDGRYSQMIAEGLLQFLSNDIHTYYTALKDSDIVIQWTGTTLDDVLGLGVASSLEAKGKKIYNVSKRRTMEGSLYIEISKDYHQVNNQVTENREKFTELVCRVGDHEKAFVFCTGPSIQEYKNYDYSGGVSIACNSVINDDELMDDVKPQILVFADPIFHFGCSSYAQAFRDKLKKTQKKHGFTIVVPNKYYPIFSHALPELAARTVALPFNNNKPVSLDLAEDFVLRTTDNILTFLMLPLATTLADTVYILGCDGRPLEKDDYFWTHNEKTQFVGEMQSIQQAHPSFFKREYNEYYLRHCDTLEEYLSNGEHQGKTFSSLTFSYIPALKKREYKYRTLVNTTQKTLFVSINPDLKDSFGHYYHYDKRLHETLKNGEDLLVLANINVDIQSDELRLEPVFTHNSWEVRSSHNTEIKIIWIEEFEQEIKNLSLLHRPKCFYMYTGAIQFARLTVDLLSEKFYENVQFSINLFYAHMDLNEDAFTSSNLYSEYKGVFHSLSSSEPQLPVAVYVDSARLQARTETKIGHKLDLWPMIRVSDSKIMCELLEEKKTKQRSEYVIFFPGTGQFSKGYDLVCQLIIEFNRQHIGKHEGTHVRFVVRDLMRDTEENNNTLNMWLGMVSGFDNVSTIQGHTDERDYLKYFLSCDIVLLPYRRSAFYSRTSSCLIDAFLFNKFVLTTADTWLADQVKTKEQGDVFNDGDINDFQKRLLGLLDRVVLEDERNSSISMAGFTPKGLRRLLIK